MNGPYEFLQPLKRLTEAQQRYERNIWVLNATLLSIAIYCLALIIGLPAFMSFYYQDSPLLAISPAILSIIRWPRCREADQEAEKAGYLSSLGPGTF